MSDKEYYKQSIRYWKRMYKEWTACQTNGPAGLSRKKNNMHSIRRTKDANFYIPRCPDAQPLHNNKLMNLEPPIRPCGSREARPMGGQSLCRAAISHTLTHTHTLVGLTQLQVQKGAQGSGVALEPTPGQQQQTPIFRDGQVKVKGRARFT